ncbi:putative ABC-type ATPase [Neorhizobium galegae]|uniref:zeta toxin family protein n=1 Tax=Neorhizobium galegae TaxID=399 RepID=UPI001AE49379|nr:zeta toxin family protein [Neorhizobium galegae]MBP2563317.1 putative ABC-type ATPase [Neorhizobium galegae]
MSKPQCTILAGPNGSGKSSIYAKMKPPGEFVNADVIEAALEGDFSKGERQIKAGRVAVTRVRELIDTKADFVFETTLSSHHSIKVIEDAIKNGFEVGLLFVALDDPLLNVKRVGFRVADGGHHIPSPDILRRYRASFLNLSRALSLVHSAAIIDNSGRIPEIVFEIENKKIVYDRSRDIEFHRTLRSLIKLFP